MQHKAGNTPQPPNQSFNLHRLSFILEKNYISPVLRLRNVANLKQNVMSNSNEYQCRLRLDMQFEMLFSCKCPAHIVQSQGSLLLHKLGGRARYSLLLPKEFKVYKYYCNSPMTQYRFNCSAVRCAFFSASIEKDGACFGLLFDI